MSVLAFVVEDWFSNTEVFLGQLGFFPDVLMHVYVCMYICTFVHTCILARVYVYVGVFICWCVHMFVPQTVSLCGIQRFSVCHGNILSVP